MNEGTQRLQSVLKAKHDDFEKVKEEFDKLGYEYIDGSFRKSLFSEKWAKELLKTSSFVKQFWHIIEEIVSFDYAEKIGGLKKGNKLIDLIREINNNFGEDIKQIAIYALRSAKNRGLNDKDTLKFMVQTLFDAGYVKDRAGDWVRRKSLSALTPTLQKIWVDTYINNGFDNDKTWAFIKKIAYHNKDTNIWQPKYSKESCMSQIRDAIDKALKNGSKLPMQMNKAFSFFMPMEFGEEDENGNRLVKVHNEKGKSFLIGTASNTQVDKEGDRVMPSFIKKMQETSIGLPVFYEHQHDIEHTLGYIDKSFGDANNFNIRVALEDPKKNEYVKKILDKIAHGTPIGFSIHGAVYEAQKAYDEPTSAEVTELIDGVVDEVSSTAWPAGNFDNMVQAIHKAMKKKDKKKDSKKVVEKDISKEGGEVEKALTHNSKTNSNEPSWGAVDKTKIPRNGHADMGDPSKKSTWGFPHHYVVGGTVGEDGVYTSGDMYLHRGGLNAAWAAAMGARSGVQASASVKSHLQAHRKALGLQKVREKYARIVAMTEDEIEKMVILENDNVRDLIVSFRTGLKDILSQDKPIEKKKTEIKKFTDKLRGQLINAINEVKNEEKNG